MENINQPERIMLRHLNEWVLEYSPSQKAFHVETVNEAIGRNISNMFKGRQTDYGIIGLFADEGNAEAACELMKQKLYSSGGSCYG